jgi:hypothetical protein
MRFTILPIITFVFSSFSVVQPSKFLIPASGLANIEAEKCAIRSFESELRDSKAVFTGKIIGESKKGDIRIFELAVEKYWKGRVGKRIKVNIYETMRYQAWFKLGEKYLIFAYESDDGALSVERCSRSKGLSEAKDDLRKLGASKRPK